MFAIVRVKGFQFLAKPGDKITVPKLNLAVNATTKFDDVLFLNTDKKVLIGNPVIKDASVDAKVLGHIRAEKVTSFKFTRREKYRRLKGHKQPLTEIEISKINYRSAD